MFWSIQVHGIQFQDKCLDIYQIIIKNNFYFIKKFMIKVLVLFFFNPNYGNVAKYIFL